MNTNLQEFWSVQQASGLDREIFTSFQEAQHSFDRWNEALDAELEKWMNGDNQAKVLIESSLEPNLSGGCYHTYRINPAARPGGICHHPMGTEQSSRWTFARGANKIQWGNKATARPHRELVKR